MKPIIIHYGRDKITANYHRFAPVNAPENMFLKPIYLPIPDSGMEVMPKKLTITITSE